MNEIKLELTELIGKKALRAWSYVRLWEGCWNAGAIRKIVWTIGNVAELQWLLEFEDKSVVNAYDVTVIGFPAELEDVYAWAIATNRAFEHPFAESFQSLEKDLRFFVEGYDSCLDVERDPAKPLMAQDESTLSEIVTFIKSYRRAVWKKN